MNMEGRVMLFEPGDRVRVCRGNATGKVGTVEELRGDRVAVRSDSTGNVRAFPPNYLQPIDALLEPSDDFPNEAESTDSVNQSENEALARLVDAEVAGAMSSASGDVHPTHEEVSPSTGDVHPTHEEVSPSTGDVHPTHEEVSPSTGDVHPTHEEVSPSTGDVHPTHEEVSPSTDVEAAIATLERECTKLRSTALTDCWIETWKRGNGHRHRLCFAAHLKKHHEYVSVKDYEVIQGRIDNGRKLKKLQAAIAILRELAK